MRGHRFRRHAEAEYAITHYAGHMFVFDHPVDADPTVTYGTNEEP